MQLFVSGMPSGRTNNFPESGRGLGHVTPTIFGSTVKGGATIFNVGGKIKWHHAVSLPQECFARSICYLFIVNSTFKQPITSSNHNQIHIYEMCER